MSAPPPSQPPSSGSSALLAHAEYRARRQFGSLDGLRGLAILAVVWHHTTGRDLAGPFAGVRRGFLGVDLFFVLSGFLIVTLLLRERDRRGQVSLRDFYARRSLRIFPLYYGLLAAFVGARLLLAPDSPRTAALFEELPFYLTYTSNWIERVTLMSPAWSLAAEEQFYLLWPPIERWLSRAVWPILLVLLALNQALNFGLFGPRWTAGYRGIEMLDVTFTPILLGVGLAHVLHTPAGFARIARGLGGWGAAPAAALVMLAIANLPTDLAGAPRLGVQLAMTALLAACVVRESNGLAPLLRFAPLVRIGVVSYGLYLLHLFGREIAVRSVGEGPWLLFPVTLALSMGLAEASYRLWESPFLRLKSRFRGEAA